MFPTYAFAQKYRAYIMGDDPAPAASSTRSSGCTGGEAQIPAFRADLARVTGRSDIDVWDNADTIGGTFRKATGYEAACLLAFGLAALLAACSLSARSSPGTPRAAPPNSACCKPWA